MSLNWDISKVKNWRKKMEKHSSTLNCLIWATLVIGMGDPNERNAEEFCYRMNRYSREVSPLAVSRNGRTFIWTLAKLKPWFGLSTNVRTISNSAFDKLVRERSGR